MRSKRGVEAARRTLMGACGGGIGDQPGTPYSAGQDSPRRSP
jgi:hypothetical protein